MRFKACCVSGYTDSGRKHVSVWYVLDSANCFHIVEEFIGGWRSEGRTLLAEERAHKLAAELEEAYP